MVDTILRANDLETLPIAIQQRLATTKSRSCKYGQTLGTNPPFAIIWGAAGIDL